MSDADTFVRRRERRHRRVRGKVLRHGRAAAPGRVPLEPRASRRSSIDDLEGKTLAAASWLQLKSRSRARRPSRRPRSASCSPQNAKKAGVETVVFDRGGYLYHGRVKALAEGAREGGLKF